MASSVLVSRNMIPGIIHILRSICSSLCRYMCGIHLCPTRMLGKMCTYMDMAGGFWRWFPSSLRLRFPSIDFVRPPPLATLAVRGRLLTVVCLIIAPAFSFNYFTVFLASLPSRSEVWGWVLRSRIFDSCTGKWNRDFPEFPYIPADVCGLWRFIGYQLDYRPSQRWLGR